MKVISDDCAHCKNHGLLYLAILKGQTIGLCYKCRSEARKKKQEYYDAQKKALSL